jgi:chitin synthase
LTALHSHLKNLLHLGEDRYLTTLLLKNFPTYKTSFCRDVMAQTIAPDEWKILLSQRRRWINSTIHNLFELLWVDRLCGFWCASQLRFHARAASLTTRSCFSMRFVVFIDLMCGRPRSPDRCS